MRARRLLLLLILLSAAVYAPAQASDDVAIPVTDPELLARFRAVAPPGARILMLPNALSGSRVLRPGDPALARYEFGTQDFAATTYTGDEFEPEAQALVDKGAGFVRFISPGYQVAVAALHLDTGVRVDGVQWWAYDAEASVNLDFNVISLCWPFSAGSPTLTALAVASTSGNAGYQFMLTPINPNVRITNNLCSYYIVMGVNNGPAIHFYRARVGWFRDVSPAPALATFGDVPIGHQQFQFVEALARAGITAGCGGGNFCPDQPLTRGQMAVFLSVALGLHFPF